MAGDDLSVTSHPYERMNPAHPSSLGFLGVLHLRDLLH